ncbi:MAG: FkbM family methyltransferase [Cyanobacteriota bacterium]
MLTLRVVSRRVRRAIKSRLGVGRDRFNKNKINLQAALAAGQEFIDLMPGIDLPMVIHPKMYFTVGYTNYVFEQETLDFIRDHLRTGDTFLDIGANVGYLSLFCANLVKQSCRVIAFEPGEFAFDLLKKNKDLNQFDNLEIYNAGLGEKDEIVQFNTGMPGMEVYNSVGKIVHPSADAEKFHTISAKFYKGSTWLKRHNVDKIDIMKLDVEGGEYLVLKGMHEIFQAQKVSRLLIEITDEMSRALGYHPSDIIYMLSDCGYEWFTLHSCGRLKPLLDKSLRNAPRDTHMFVAVAPPQRK